MINDIRTVIWKERKGLFRYRGSRSRFLLTLLTPILLAIVFPWQWGADWVEEFPSVFLSALIPVIVVVITIPESFAGERERHTLGTLLASRLPDWAILFGKLTVSVAFAWGLTLLVLLLSLVTVNLAHGEGELLFYAPIIALADVVLSFLLATVCAGAGILISMRSSTVQEATQTLSAILFIPPMIAQFGLFLFLDEIIEYLKKLDGELILVIVIAVFALIDLGLHTAVLSRFRRSRLILS